jgi:hypothetical protein
MTAEFHEFVDFLNRLEAARIYYTLCKVREDTVMIIAYVPGQHWEIEFTTDGEWEVEVFKSDGTIMDKHSLDTLLRNFGEPRGRIAGIPGTPGTE